MLVLKVVLKNQIELKIVFLRVHELFQNQGDKKVRGS